MRLLITHETAYRYSAPANRAVEILRLTPRSHDGQYIVDWRIEVDQDCRLEQGVDPFGNPVHSFTIDRPFDHLTITAIGEAETEDRSGIVRGQVEPLPLPVFLRDTALTESDRPIRELAAATAAGGGGRLEVLHRLVAGLRERMRFNAEATESNATAIEAYARGEGVCQDFANVFIAALRHLDIPARYVSGYLHQPPPAGPKSAGHAWAEAFVDGIGWIGFDPVNGISPTDAYLRVAVGLDSLGAAPIRGTRFGGRDEQMTVTVTVENAGLPGG
jgi:transglutaminase-like putative cysteine protease